MTISRRRICAAALALLFAALGLCGCAANRTQSDPSDVLTTTAPLSGDVTTTQPQADEDTGENENLEIDTYVILNDDATAIKGSGAAYADSVLTVSAPGVYSIKGKLTDGQIRVDTDDENAKVTWRSIAARARRSILKIRPKRRRSFWQRAAKTSCRTTPTAR